MILRGPSRHGSVVCLSESHHGDPPGEWVWNTVYWDAGWREEGEGGRQGWTQPIHLRGFQGELRRLSVNLSEFLVNLRGFWPGLLAQTRRFDVDVYIYIYIAV